MKTTFDVPDSIVGQCIEKFGYNLSNNIQIDVLQEECAELIQALSKLKRGKDMAIDMVKEELTHVMMSSAIIAKMYDITNGDILNEIEKKADKYSFYKEWKIDAK